LTPPCSIGVRLAPKVTPFAGIAQATFANAPAEHAVLVGWMMSHRPARRVGIEGAGNYAWQLTLALQRAGEDVRELPGRLTRRERRHQRHPGTSHPTDAVAITSRACARVSAYMTSCSAAFAWLEPLREVVEDVAEIVEPIPVRTGLRPQVAEHRLPALGALAVAVLDGDQRLCAIGPRAYHDGRAEAVVFQQNVEVDAIDPHVHVVAIGEAALLERAVLRLPRTAAHTALASLALNG
jgi:hypothetical protein